MLRAYVKSTMLIETFSTSLFHFFARRVIGLARSLFVTSFLFLLSSLMYHSLEILRRRSWSGPSFMVMSSGPGSAWSAVCIVFFQGWISYWQYDDVGLWVVWRNLNGFLVGHYYAFWHSCDAADTGFGGSVFIWPGIKRYSSTTVNISWGLLMSKSSTNN